jgi:enoyl-CoA hydratase/carnithine racemase
MIDGTDAYRLGIVHYLVPQDQVMAKSMEVAKNFASKPRATMRITKNFAWERRKNEFREILGVAKETQRRTFSEQGDAGKAVAAFLQPKK